MDHIDTIIAEATLTERTVYRAARDLGASYERALHLAFELPRDTRPVRENNGWYIGVHAAERAAEKGDYSLYVFGSVGTPEYKTAFQSAAKAVFLVEDGGEMPEWAKPPKF